MGDYFFNKDISRWNATGTGTNAGVTVTKAADATTPAIHCVTGIQCSGDAACVVTIESPASTVLWRKRFSAAFTHSEAWPMGELQGASGQAVLVKISASTSNCEANIQGISIKG